VHGVALLSVPVHVHDQGPVPDTTEGFPEAHRFNGLDKLDGVEITAVALSKPHNPGVVVGPPPPPPPPLPEGAVEE